MDLRSVRAARATATVLTALALAGCATIDTGGDATAGSAVETTGSVGGATPGSGRAPGTAPSGRTCAPAALPAGTSERHVDVDGTDRTYLAHVPTGPVADGPTPLVVTFHGLGSTSARQLAYSRFAGIADREGFFVVAPQAQGTPPRWDLFTPASTPGSDAAFVERMLDDVASWACIDHDRVYANGISLGSGVVFAEMCAGNPRFAAYAGVAVTFYAEPCGAAPPTPIRYFHGTADAIVPIDGGRSILATVKPARTGIDGWAAHNGCEPEPLEERVGTSIRRLVWTGCDAGADVVYDVIEGGGHTWPGSTGMPVAAFGPTTGEVDATEEMWRFFVDHPRRAR